MHYGNKPNFERFFLPLIAEARELHTTGIQVMFGRDTITYVPCITNCVCDLPAKHTLMGFKMHNGYESCTVCTNKGESIDGTVRFTERSVRSSVRTSMDTANHMRAAVTGNTVVKGVKGLSVMIAIPSFHLINGFSIQNKKIRK